MPDALFVGGGTGGGNTTLARLLAARHGLRVLAVDSFWYAHAPHAGETPPSPDVQWLEWTPVTQAADFERISRLMLGYVLDDLPSLPDQPVVVVEGPQIVPDLLPRDATAVFLVPTPAFQRQVLSPRPMPSSDPRRALAARLVKDRLYADRIATLARGRGFPVIEVDGTVAPSVIRAQVEDQFADLLRQASREISPTSEGGRTRTWHRTSTPGSRPAIHAAVQKLPSLSHANAVGSAAEYGSN